MTMISSIFTLLLSLLCTSTALILPPSDKIAMGMGADLKDGCLDHALEVPSTIFHYDESSTTGAQLGRSLFGTIASAGRQRSKLFLPLFSNYGNEIERIIRIINDNSKLLGGCNGYVQHCPDVTASCITIEFKGEATNVYDVEDAETVESQIRDTEQYVDKTLSGSLSNEFAVCHSNLANAFAQVSGSVRSRNRCACLLSALRRWACSPAL